MKQKQKTSFSPSLSRSTRKFSEKNFAHSRAVALRESPLETWVNEVFVFGNEDLSEDSLPLRILPLLQKKFPEIHFVTLDPNEEWDVPEDVCMLDTAVGITDVTVFDSLDAFSAPPRIGMHDFDALTNLRYLQKLGKIKKIKIIAVPPDMSESDAIHGVSHHL